MSCFNFPKKLKQLPSSSKKAWRSFTSSLSPKLRGIRNHSLDLTKATTRRLLELRANKRHHRPHPPRGGRGGAFYHYKQYNYNNNYYYQHLVASSSVPNSPATVYIDRLFGEPPSSKEANTTGVNMEAASTSGESDGTLRNSGGGGGRRKKRKTKRSHNNSSTNNNKTTNKNWKEYISSMPTIKGVDERAEEFISNFRQQMVIQREQSLVEFQEMLARSA